MVATAVYLVLFLAMTGYSSATYCLCNSGLSDSVLQKNIDYACGAGADCSQIAQNGSCYNPNTVKDHCNYAVNSYFQSKNQANGSCDFSGTATTSQTIPNQNPGCVYASSPSTGGSNGTTPATSPSTTPSGGTTTPSGGTTTAPPPPSSGFNLGPTAGSGGTTPTDNQATVTALQHQKTHLFWSLTLTLLL